MTNVAHWSFFIDGAARHNPGPAGIGIYGIDATGACICKKGFYVGKKTNNQAEYLALAIAAVLIRKIQAALDLKRLPRILFISDSLLLVKQMQGHWSVKNDTIKCLIKFFRQEIGDCLISFKHVLREENTKADLLANHGIDAKKCLTQNIIVRLHEYGITI